MSIIATAQSVVDIPTAKKLASVLIDQNEPRAARKILVELRIRAPNDPVILTHLSRAERALGNPKDAISSIETTVNATATLRLPSTEKAINSIGLSYFGKRVSLGSEAARIDPDLSDEDFSFDRLGLEWSGRYRSTDKDGILDVTTTLFSDRFGGDSFQTGQRVQAGYTWPVATKQTLRLGVDLTRLNRLDSDVRSSDNVTVWARRSILLDNNSQMSVRASLTDIDSRSASVAHSAEFIGLVYALGKPVATAFWAFAFDVRRADFDDSAFTFLDPQEDTQYIFSASATFPELDVLGFAPVIEFRHERN